MDTNEKSETRISRIFTNSFRPICVDSCNSCQTVPFPPPISAFCFPLSVFTSLFGRRSQNSQAHHQQPLPSICPCARSIHASRPHSLVENRGQGSTSI